MKKPMRRVVKKDVGEVLPGQRPLFPSELLKEMPLANRRTAQGSLVFKSTHAELHIGNLEEPVVWSLDIVRKAAEPSAIAKAFSPIGSRFTRTLKEIPAALLQQTREAAPGATIAGMTELGLQSDDDHEYFLSKFGELCGVIRVQRKADGSWKAGLAKTNLPRVLSKEAVSQGIMPPLGHSGLPKSLEAVVPEEYQFWKAKDASSALELRNQLVESGFLDEASIQPVDGELRKVVTRHFLYDPAEHVKAPSKPSLAEAVAAAVPDSLMGKGFTPMESEDWLEKLDAGDAEGALAVLSPADRSQPAREMVRAVKTLKADFLLEHDDTRANRAAFTGLGVLFKLASHPDRLFCTSFAPVCDVQKLDDDIVVASMKFQGIAIDIDRPKGYVQTGKDADGNAWERTYLFDYGFFPNTKGGDGDNLDVFVGPNADSDRVFWVTQNKADGSFDEYKVFVGFDSAREARDAFAAHIPLKYYAGMSELPIGTLKSLLGVEPEELRKRLAKVAGVSYEQLRAAVNAALTEKFPQDDGVCSPCGYYCDDVYDDHAIFYKDGQSYSIPFTYAGGVATLTGEPAAVVRTWVPADQAAGATKPEDAAVPAPEQQKSQKRQLRLLKAGEIDLGPNHNPIAHVPKGGSSCASCKFLGEDGASCMNEYVAKFTGKANPVPLPYPADETCSDWWEQGSADASADKSMQDAFNKAMSTYLKIGKRAPVKKDERYVLGVVLEPDVVDAQMDTYSADEVRSASEKFMENFRNMGLMHKQLVNEKVKILESYVAPTDMTLDNGQTVKKGTWMMAVRVNDDALWDQVKKGGLTGFSIGGSAIRKPVSQDV